MNALTDCTVVFFVCVVICLLFIAFNQQGALSLAWVFQLVFQNSVHLQHWNNHPPNVSPTCKSFLGSYMIFHIVFAHIGVSGSGEIPSANHFVL